MVCEIKRGVEGNAKAFGLSKRKMKSLLTKRGMIVEGVSFGKRNLELIFSMFTLTGLLDIQKEM